MAQLDVHNVLGVIHGGLQEVVPNLPTVFGVGDLHTVQEPLNLQVGASVWNKLFVSKSQTFFNSNPVVESFPWSARASPSALTTKISAEPSTILVSPEVLPQESHTVSDLFHHRELLEASTHVCYELEFPRLSQSCLRLPRTAQGRPQPSRATQDRPQLPRTAQDCP